MARAPVAASMKPTFAAFLRITAVVTVVGATLFYARPTDLPAVGDRPMSVAPTLFLTPFLTLPVLHALLSP